jgi:replication initiation and membrane attachment protein DnaB
MLKNLNLQSWKQKKEKQKQKQPICSKEKKNEPGWSNHERRDEE